MQPSVTLDSNIESKNATDSIKTDSNNAKNTESTTQDSINKTESNNAKPKEKKKITPIPPLHFHRKRYFVYAIITIVVMIMPFIRLGDGGHHLFLLSFDHKVLHLGGVEYSIQEFYVMPFMLIILFVGIFLMTSMGGRVWCGWGCPQTLFRMIYRDIIQTHLLKLRKKVSNKQEVLVLDSASKWARFIVGLAIFTALALIAAANFLFFFVPPEDFFAYISDVGNHQMLLGFWLVIAGLMTFEVCFIAEKFCIYMCPYARVQSVLFDDNTLMSIYNVERGGAVYRPNGEAIGIAPKKQNPANECTNCLHCVKVCPTHIDIRKGVQLECVNCLECVDACSEVMGKLGRPSLVTWSSPNAIAQHNKVKLFRAKTIGYIVLLCIVFAALLVVSNIRKSMLLNINRDAQLYMIRDSGAVDNAYKFLIQNKDSKEHRFSFEILGDMAKDFEIKVLDHEGEKDFLIHPNGDKRLTVLIRAKQSLNDSMNEDRNIPLIIRAFAVDDKENINITYTTFFMYPSQKAINAKLGK
ncbi:cytochrome c oxidase accessory protein CcoG [Helicobacter saguini]|uniref:Cytochrome c oxidase accessory protein CcoG n=1 Tax=Helicobacter saguini TaxID=1548018 RepID=A0A347VXW7_9HELI|nr:cytochrome c oxidase accessory protein CcoG [Helicobacter saguini]MWV61466.1 cytochrome c oxidase accessory protein CcoG [Helicobacter saguini]MWV67862.1 cytochrome c oxidase accessory protein CcoG [Helicobacter saguini]MWV70669.1 cytochrome c oxidase accessory protein CcoG [Helicobacter saguini]MWV72573.1 cytochrome c oxidase accessory protein CcoG [Helicobacter saguini]TLD94694.1 cytochrome c oxidase accessory protein CcoG [Helicobacter saguini]